MDLKIKSRQLANDVLLVVPEGAIDSFSSEAFAQQSGRILKQSPAAVLIDLVNVKYISSVGLGVLITLMKKLQEKKCAFGIYDPQLSVRRVLEISRLDFLEIKAEGLDPANPFFSYLQAEEPKRQAKRAEALEKQNKQAQAPGKK